MAPYNDRPMANNRLRSAIEKIYRAALAAVDPSRAVKRFLSLEGRRLQAGRRSYNLNDFRKVYLLGVGKAGVPMARAVEEVLGEWLVSGFVVVKSAAGAKLKKTALREARHPEPDERGLAAAREMLQFADSNLTREDLLLMVISGGGSALLPAPAEGVSLSDKQAVTRALLHCGATIQEMNAIRKHLSRIKGGRLLEHANGCEVVAMMLSDVVGDDMASIASGPTSPDPTTFADCLEIIQRYEIREQLPATVVEHLENGARESSHPGHSRETPKPGDKRFQRVHNAVIANNFLALEAAAAKSRSLGFEPIILSSSVYGNNSDVARFNVAMAREILKTGNPTSPPCCLISGGETTLQVKGAGKGGRNQEFALWCAREIAEWGDAPVLFASVGSDGCDGPTDAAGALAAPDTAQRARDLRLSIKEHLERNDSYHFFKKLGDLIITGDTQTNVMDFQIVLVDAAAT